MSGEEGRRQLIIVCSHGMRPEQVVDRRDKPRDLGGLVWVDDIGLTISFAEKRGVAYRRISVTGNHGRAFYETDDPSCLELRCGRCGREKDVLTKRFAALFGEGGQPRVSRLDLSKLE